jgi:hypothetical protein
VWRYRRMATLFRQLKRPRRSAPPIFLNWSEICSVIVIVRPTCRRACCPIRCQWRRPILNRTGGGYVPNESGVRDVLLSCMRRALRISGFGFPIHVMSVVRQFALWPRAIEAHASRHLRRHHTKRSAGGRPMERACTFRRHDVKDWPPDWRKQTFATPATERSMARIMCRPLTWWTRRPQSAGRSTPRARPYVRYVALRGGATQDSQCL